MERPLTQNIRQGEAPLNLEQYERAGGYQALRKALLTMTPRGVQEEVKKANLLGRGGAGVATAFKWRFVPLGDDAPYPKYFIVNGDEMEPGTFKDRLLMEGDPHQLIESAILCSYAIEANIAYIFLRWAYRKSARLIGAAIQEAYQAGYLGENILGSNYSLELHLHSSAGRYICGEETGLLNALEGKPSMPRAKPPFPQTSGLFGQPTIVNNVETVCNVPHIINNGSDWFKSLSKTGDGGTKIYGVSGNVNNPGAWELPMGTTLRELIEEHAGGMRDGYTFRGALPGGASTGFLLEKHLDLPMDFITMNKAGTRLGTGTVIVLDDQTSVVGMMKNLMHFFAQESCGWCIPCREGLPWIEKVVHAIASGKGKKTDIQWLERQCKLLGPGNTFCALAPGAIAPLQSAIQYFREDFESLIAE